MFSFFRKRRNTTSSLAAPGSAANNSRGAMRPLQSLFAAKFVPMSMSSHRAEFINSMISDQATQFLQLMWNSLGKVLVKPHEVFPPDGLEGFVFREEPYLFVGIIFPPPLARCEGYFGVVVIGPCPSGKLTIDELAGPAPYRYFVLFHDEAATKVVELTDEVFRDLGPGPQPDPRVFVDWVRSAVLPGANITSIVGDSPDMAAAIAAAKAQVPDVLARFQAGEFQHDHFAIKVRIQTSTGEEFPWVDQVTCSDGQVSGVLDADPQSEGVPRRGERWTGMLHDVVDWSVMRDGKLYGHHTLRVLLPSMPPNKAAPLRAALADTSPPSAR